jgi:hypothetical protein
MQPIETSIQPEDFARVCYLALMQNGDGLKDKHPSYIKEKLEMLTAGYDAFSYLDFKNMAKVIEWLNTWKLVIPTPIEREWTAQCDAMSDWVTKGIHII